MGKGVLNNIYTFRPGEPGRLGCWAGFVIHKVCLRPMNRRVETKKKLILQGLTILLIHPRHRISH